MNSSEAGPLVTASQLLSSAYHRQEQDAAQLNINTAGATLKKPLPIKTRIKL